jgi:hypothetical protein
MEDDVEFSNGFMHSWGTAKASLDALEGGWDYVCVGGDQHLLGADGDASSFGREAGAGILEVDKYVNYHSHAYMLTKGAAQFLLDRAAEEGIHCGAWPPHHAWTPFLTFSSRSSFFNLYSPRPCSK